jgi:hypothetical protein
VIDKLTVEDFEYQYQSRPLSLRLGIFLGEVCPKCSSLFDLKAHFCTNCGRMKPSEAKGEEEILLRRDLAATMIQARFRGAIGRKEALEMRRIRAMERLEFQVDTASFTSTGSGKSPFAKVNRIGKEEIDWDDIMEVESDDGTIKKLTKKQRIERRKRKDEEAQSVTLEKNVKHKVTLCASSSFLLLRSMRCVLVSFLIVPSSLSTSMMSSQSISSFPIRLTFANGLLPEPVEVKDAVST